MRLSSGEAFTCRGDERVLLAMERAGLRAIPVGCRGGGCGACRVEILQGQVRRLVMSRDWVDAAAAARGLALACRLLPRSDLTLRPAPHPRGPAGDL